MITLDLHENCLGFEVHHRDRLVTLYRAREELPRTESPKPCFAPIYTPSGRLITEYRPPDHPWHTGLFFGWVHANDANLWGGPLYNVDTKKYEYVESSHDRQCHDGFTELSMDGDAVVVQEAIDWLDARDNRIAVERRCYGLRVMEESAGYFWTIETKIEPVEGSLNLGATKADARYSGLVLRMGPQFAGQSEREALHRSSEGVRSHQNLMGSCARWASVSGVDGGAVVMMDHPDNVRHPTSWYARFNLLGVSPLRNGDLFIDKPDVLELKYGLVILDSELPEEEAEGMYAEFLATPSLQQRS